MLKLNIGTPALTIDQLKDRLNELITLDINIDSDALKKEIQNALNNDKDDNYNQINIQEEFDSNHFVFKWKISEAFTQTEESLDTLRTTIKELVEKFFRLGRNISHTVRYYVDNIDWDLTTEQ